MNKKKVAKELLKLAKGLTAKKEIVDLNDNPSIMEIKRAWSKNLVFMGKSVADIINSFPYKLSSAAEEMIDDAMIDMIYMGYNSKDGEFVVCYDVESTSDEYTITPTSAFVFFKITPNFKLKVIRKYVENDMRSERAIRSLQRRLKLVDLYKEH